MKCPECGSRHGKVRETRERSDGKIRRRRVCHACGTRWSTVELILRRRVKP